MTRNLSIVMALVVAFACANSLVEEDYFTISVNDCPYFQESNLEVQRYSESLNGSIPEIHCQVEWGEESGKGKRAATSEIERIKKEEDVNTDENALLNGYSEL